MDWDIFWTVIATGSAVVGLIYAYLRNFRMDMDSKFNKLDTDIRAANNRIDKLYEIFMQEQQAWNARFEKINEKFEQKFYDLLKEKKV